MTFAPQTLKNLAAYWVAQGGVNSGIVGDADHQKRASYHNGQDVIEAYKRTSATDYTIRLARDREPFLTNASSAIDLGRLDGSLVNLQRFSRWFSAQCQAGAPGTEDVREFIYSPDGMTVLRWDGAAGVLRLGGTGTGQGDDSHRWHSHLAFYRDAEYRDKRPLFAPFFTPLPDTSTGDDMLVVVNAQTFAPRTWRVAAGVTLNGYDPAQPGKIVRSQKFSSPSQAQADAIVGISYPGTTNPPVPKGGPFLRVTNGTFAGLLIVAGLVSLDPEPALDCSAAVKAATDPLNAKIAAKNASLRLIASEASAAAE